MWARSRSSRWIKRPDEHDRRRPRRRRRRAPPSRCPRWRSACAGPSPRRRTLLTSDVTVAAAPGERAAFVTGLAHIGRLASLLQAARRAAPPLRSRRFRRVCERPHERPHGAPRRSGPGRRSAVPAPPRAAPRRRRRSGSTQCANTTRAVPRSDQSRNSSGRRAPGSRGAASRSARRGPRRAHRVPSSSTMNGRLAEQLVESDVRPACRGSASAPAGRARRSPSA